MLLLTLLVLSSAIGTDPTPGALVVAGGGRLPAEIRARALELAGGPEAAVLVVPWASRREDAGERGAAAWREAGARRVSVLAENRDSARQQIAQADLIWLGGCSQSRLMERLGRDLSEALRARHRAGATVAGSSAGAAVMSARMITGDADLESLRGQTTKLAPGLGLWPGVLVDQHFHRRRRFNRLFSAVLDDPRLVGIGIDEGTAVIVRGQELEVVGESSVLVIDGRRIRGRRGTPGEPSAAKGVTVHLLGSGMTHRLPHHAPRIH